MRSALRRPVSHGAKPWRAGAWCAWLLAAVAPPAPAHHSFAAEFDPARAVGVSGAITELSWSNPHVWLHFEVAHRDHSVVSWMAELTSPNALADRGLQKKDLEVGSTIHLQGYRAKDGSTLAYAVRLTLADGRSFQAGGVDCPAQSADAAVPFGGFGR